MSKTILTALPVFNEENYVADVISEVLRHSDQVLVVDDGSTDSTATKLLDFPQVRVLSHEQNRGYGAALVTAFEAALEGGYEALVTLDCDGQHQPGMINEIAQRLDAAGEPIDMVSGSRYLAEFAGNSTPPEERRRINHRITACLNERLGFRITDAFCGFKAYRVSSLAKLEITENGYAMPLQLWIQAADLGWRVEEFAVPLLYLDENRSFGGSLDDSERRLAHYRDVLNAELERRGMAQRFTADCGGA